MTTFELYRKHKSGEISREKFLYEVRRDNNLPWITNLTSYNDAITILKNKGIVTDETPAIVGIPAVGLMTEAKETKIELTLDTVNPYEYRHGLQYELAELDDYSNEALEKAKATVLKNLNKDANFYSTLLNQKQSSFEFKKTETDAKGMQAKADGHLKKELKKDEKANVQDSLGKKEEGSKKPKGVKVMPDKGVTGSEKTIKEGLEEAFNLNTAFKTSPSSHSYNDVLDIFTSYEDENILNAFKAKFPEGKDISKVDYLKFAMNYIDDMSASSDIMANWISVSDPDVYEKAGLVEAKAKKYVVFDKARGENASKFFDTKEEAEAELKKINAEDPHHGDYVIDIEEGSFMGGVDLGASFEKMKGEMSAEDEFESLVKKYDWYAEMSDDPRKWNAQQSMEADLRQLSKTIGVDKAVEIFNRYAPSDRKVTSSDTMWGMNEDKHAKIKEALKKALKEADPTLTKLEKDEETAEKALANILKKKADILNKPGTQG